MSGPHLAVGCLLVPGQTARLGAQVHGLQRRVLHACPTPGFDSTPAHPLLQGQPDVSLSRCRQG